MENRVGNRRYLKDIQKFEQNLILLYDIARAWNRQAGGYMSSDTFHLMMIVEEYINEMIDHNQDFKCFREKDGEL